MKGASRLWLRLWACFALAIVASAPVQAQQQQQNDSYKDGLDTGKALREGSQSVPQQDITPEVLPSYSVPPADLTGIYDETDDGALNSAAGSAASNESYNLMRQGDAQRARIPAGSNNDIRDRGELINEDPQAYATGMSTTGDQGKCEAITRPGQTEFYEASCNVGSAVQETHPSCQVTLDHHFSPGYRYQCTDIKIQGQLCINAWGYGCITLNYTISSGCGSFAAAGCTATATGSNVFGSYSGLNYTENSFSYLCQSAVSYSVTGQPMTLNGSTYMASASGPSSNAGYVNSTRNESLCADNQLNGCPPGSVLEGNLCVSRQPATLSYVCESGWTLVGTQCTQTISQAAAIAGFNCPSGYALEGDLCVSRVPATPAYGCEAGWTVEGNECTRVAAHPATGEWQCPTDWTLSGTMCYRSVTEPATPVFGCPIGWTQQGTDCVRQTSHPAAGSYSCPVGWTLNGTICSQVVTGPATGGYACPSGWALNGSTCTLDEVQPATGTPLCNAGFTYDGTQCIRPWSVAATENFTCPVDWSYIGNATCFQMTSEPPNFALYPTGCSNGSTPIVIDLGQWGSSSFCLISITQPASGFYSCTTGTLQGNMCVGTDVAAPVGTGYSCPIGWTLSGTNCLRSTSQAATQIFSCQPGWTLNGNQCTGTVTQPAAVGYSCAPTEVLVGSDCVATETQPATAGYECRAGLTLNGSICSGTLSDPAAFVYVCPPGEALSATDCLGTERKPADVNYSCANGTIVGDQCETTAQPTPAGLDCPVGFSLSEPGFCSKTTTVAAGANYQCPANSANSGTQCVSYYDPVVNASQECTVESEVCSDASPATRVIDGVSITQACWAWTRTFTCSRVTTGNNDCQEYDGNARCTFDREICLDDPPSGGGCVVAERIYKCPIPGQSGPPQTEYMCNGDVYCVNGTCEQVEREANNELKDALVALNAMDQADKEFDPSTLTLFKGTRETCKKPIFGLVNCCAGKSSGLLSTAAGTAALTGGPVALAAVATQFLTMFLCSSAEKQLDVKDRMGLCHYLGSYCSSRFLGICTTSRKAYCCFQSKLTRILQEQGRSQINKPWGAPRTEQCLGFTADEFSRLDLSVMDFSEVYAEFLEKAKLPAEVEMAGEIQAKIRDYYQSHGAN